MNFQRISDRETIPEMDRQVLHQQITQLRGQRIGLLKGGRSLEREASLWSAKFVEKSLQRMGIEFVEIDPSAAQFWQLMEGCDIVFNCLHGRYGEDGEIQGLLESFAMPYTGSSVLASAVGMDKVIFKSVLRSLSIPTPNWCNCSPFVELPFPTVLKPRSEGGSIGIRYIASIDELAQSLVGINTEEYFIEQFIPGRIVTIACLEVIGKFYVIHPLEIQLTKGQIFYDYATKYGVGGIQTKWADTVPDDVLDKAFQAVVKIISTLQIRGCCRFDLVITDDSVEFLEMNSIPGFQPEGNFHTSLNLAGLGYDEMIVALLLSARTRVTETIS